MQPISLMLCTEAMFKCIISLKEKKLVNEDFVLL